MTILIDFQTRTNEFYREAVRRVAAGAIGPLVSGEAVYYCDRTFDPNAPQPADSRNPEKRLRSWGLDRVLSGDIITGQNIHALAVAPWILGRMAAYTKTEVTWEEMLKRGEKLEFPTSGLKA